MYDLWYNKNIHSKPPRVLVTRRGHGQSLREIDLDSIASRTPSIYQIRHVESGKVYVGSAVNPHQRCYEHRSILSRGLHHSAYLQRAWNKYGESAFVFEIVEPVLLVEDLIAREQYWIDALHASDPAHGYNTAPVAGSNLGMKHTDERRAKMSKIMKARFADPAYRAAHTERQRKWMADPAYRARVGVTAKARQADPAVRAKMSERAKLQFASPDARAKSSERAKAQSADPAVRAKRSKAQKARLADPAERAKMSERAKTRLADPAVRAKISAQVKATMSDPEYRAKISAARKAQWDDPAFRARQMELRKQSPVNRALNGEANRSSKFTTAQVVEMRRRYDSKESTIRELADDFGANLNYMRSIVHRLVWKHLP